MSLPVDTPGEAGPAYRADGRRVSAEAFYALACDPRRSVVVEACAGAGKTWMLVSRILRALLDGTPPQHILAITFTRKAAGEMRARLDEWLASFSATRSTHEQRVAALCERGLSGPAAQALAPTLAGLHEQLLRSGRSVEVRTFHGWFAQLTAHAPLALLQALGLPVAYEAIEDTAVLRDALMRRFQRAVQADDALRADYLMLVRRHRRGTLAQWLQAAWQKGPELALADAAGHAEQAVPPAHALWPECLGLADPAELLQRAPLAGEIDALARALGRAAKAKPEAAARGLRAALQASDAAAAFDLAWRALFTDAGSPRKQLGDSAQQLAVADSLQRVRQMRAQQSAHEDQLAMLRLSREQWAQYAALKRQRGLVDMADLERVAAALLGDSALAGWVQERLDQRVRHVLIDEFQDTSPLQWQLLGGWLGAYAGAGGGLSGQQPPAVFVVGDPKQSIYRFRGAEPRVFAAAQDFVMQGLQGTLLQCDHTRRNAPGVLQALNVVFDDAARADGWGPYRAHSTSVATGGQVCRLPGVARPPRAQRDEATADGRWRDSLTEPRDEPDLHLRDLEADQAAAAVAALLHDQGLQPGDVMVLARQRVMLARVAQALARLGVPHVVAEALTLHEAPESLDLVALLDVLVSPGHDLALARALRSPLLGASDEDLLWLARQVQGTGQAWLPSLLAAPQLPGPVLQRAQRLLAAWRAAAPQLPPHDLLDRVVHEGDLTARLAAAVPAARRPAALHAVHALLAAALAHDGGRFATVYGFVRAVRAGRVSASGVAPPAAVQLLTVHGAKGLEARAVVIVDSDAQPRPPERAGVLVDWPVELLAPRGVAFLRSAAAVPPSLARIWAAEQAAQAREELNSLYVAMTRAREWLVFSRTEPRYASPTRSWWARVEASAAAWVPPPAVHGTPRDGEPAALPLMPHWQGACMPPREPGSLPGHADAARLGQAVHRMLEWAGQRAQPLPRAQWPAASLAAAAAVGLPPEAAGRVLAQAQQVLDSPACARFFNGPALRWAGAEVPVAWQGQPLRIDRLVALDEGQGVCWWVLDFKLADDPASVPAYREQLQRYVAAVQALQPGEPVRGAFITGQGELLG